MPEAYKPIEQESRFERYKHARKVFDSPENANDLHIKQGSTEVGLFIPSELDLVYKVMNDFITGEDIDVSGIFFDAGSGDGRIAHVASLLGFSKCYGIEYSESVYRKSIAQTKELENIDALPQDVVHLVRGDFTNPETYTNNGIPIDTISLFYNYVNNWDSIADFIAVHAKSGARYMLFDNADSKSAIVERVTQNDNITHIKTVQYVTWFDSKNIEEITQEVKEQMQQADASTEIKESSSKSFTYSLPKYRIHTFYLFEKR